MPATRRPERDPDLAGAISRGARYAQEGTCVPWATMAAIERATRDAVERRTAATLAAERRGLLQRLRDRLTGRVARAR